MTDNFVKDMYVMYEGVPHVILERQYKTQGRQGGLIILKMRNLNVGNIVTHTFKAGFKLEEVEVQHKDIQYQYMDAKDAYFMDMETYETVTVPLDILDGYQYYMKPGDTIITVWFGSRVLNIKKQPSVVLKIVEAEEAVKGDTVNNVYKNAVTETGLDIKVPLFISKGDFISINTDSGEYTGRVSQGK